MTPRKKYTYISHHIQCETLIEAINRYLSVMARMIAAMKDYSFNIQKILQAEQGGCALFTA